MSAFGLRLAVAVLLTFLVQYVYSEPLRAEVLVTEPATLDKEGEYYRITRDITVSGTAFTITADNITLDLDGHIVTYNTDSGSSCNAIRISSRGVTVNNGIIIQGSGKSSSSHAVSVSGSNHEIHHLIIRVTGDRTRGISSNANSSSFHHNFINVQGTTDDIAYAPDCMFLEARNVGGLSVYDNILVDGHRGINFDLVGINTSTPARSKVYNNLIQPKRTPGCKQPVGIAMTHAFNVDIHNNQVISDDARGDYFSAYGLGSTLGVGDIDYHDNRVDVQYSIPVVGSVPYPENNVYGLNLRFHVHNINIENNIVMVENDVNGFNWAVKCGSGGTDPMMKNILIQNNILIARDSGGESRGSYVFFWEEAEEVTCINNKYFTDGELQGSWIPDPIVHFTFAGNSAISPVAYTPAEPSGLRLTKFLDSYLLQWDDNNQNQVYEYYVYRDGKKIPGISARGGTFYVDVDVGGVHTYSISALTLAGMEGPRCSEVSTTGAQNGWWGEQSGNPPGPPGRLRSL